MNSGDIIIIIFNRYLFKGLRNNLFRICRLYIILLYILIFIIIILYYNIKCECVKISFVYLNDFIVVCIKRI